MAETTIARPRPLAAPVRRLGGAVGTTRGVASSPTRIRATVPRRPSRVTRDLRTATFRCVSSRRGTYWIERSIYSSRIAARSA